MKNYDLTTVDGIKQVYEETFLPLQEKEEWQSWLADYVQILEIVRDNPVDELATPEIQQKLWETNTISGNGMCTIPMTEAIQSDELAKWIAALRDRELPASGESRIEAIRQIHDELVERTKPFSKRRPWLKIIRLLATIFPMDISCVVDHGKLRQLTKALFVKMVRGQSDMVTMNSLVYQRIDEALGPPNYDAESLAKRSMFAWELYYFIAKEGEEEVGEVESKRPGGSQLKFLPNARRTKGIASLAGYVDTALKILDFVQNGATRSETLEYYQQEQPQLKESSAKSQLNTIRHTLGLLKLDGNTLRPSLLGRKLLDTEDATILIPRVLTRVIGFDLLLYDLHQKSPSGRAELLDAQKKHYPNWTTNFAPRSQLAWAQYLGMVEVNEQQQYLLTEVGQEWAQQIVHQIKERPKPITEGVSQIGDPDSGGMEDGGSEDFKKPTLEEILEYFDKLPFVFPRDIIARLHVALHMHSSKHFVLLSGLSGTGKTKLAELYANAYHRVATKQLNRYFRLVPVQPDWTDPAGLLGYVNPLQETVTYAATDFLMFLKSAVAAPKLPHFVCLDEMNLARVEHYFAPLLSAMETTQDIVIHQNDEPVDTIEPSLPWPSNLYIIGTVNMDETTHAFSDKVLDRAFTLEFWDVDLDAFGERFAMGQTSYPTELLKYTIEKLKGLQVILEPAHQHFGYRTAGEVLAFLGTNDSHGAGVMNRESAFDQALLMKVLPKIRGQDSPEFRSCLEQLHSFLIGNGFVVSAQKIEAMKAELEMTGTTRFWR